MAYAAKVERQQRASTLLVVIALHALVAWIAMLWAPPSYFIDSRSPLPLISVDIAIPPPPIELEELATPAPGEEGEPSASSLKANPTPIIDPLPEIELPTISPVNVSLTAGTGLDALRGAADRLGDGLGLGVAGDGLGSGDAGDGTGAGIGTRASIIRSTALDAYDYPRKLRRSWPNGGYVFVIVNVQTNGRATDCALQGSIGDSAIDRETCRLIEERVRFRPARDVDGNPIVVPYAYVQYDARRR